jgi:hypothetical protein
LFEDLKEIHIKQRQYAQVLEYTITQGKVVELEGSQDKVKIDINPKVVNE